MKNKSHDKPTVLKRITRYHNVTKENGRLRYVRNTRRFERDGNNYSSTMTTFSLDLIGSVVAILIACCVIRALADNGANVTFYGFLNMLANCPTVDLSVITPWFGELQFTGFWSIFEPIAEFLQTTLQLVCYFGVSLWNALMYALYFVGFLFGY